MLGDPGNEYAAKLRLRHGLPKDLKEIYSKFGAVLPTFNGDESWTLPLATRLVVDREGMIRAIDANADYTKRPEPEESLEVVKALA